MVWLLPLMLRGLIRQRDRAAEFGVRLISRSSQLAVAKVARVRLTSSRSCTEHTSPAAARGRFASDFGARVVLDRSSAEWRRRDSWARRASTKGGRGVGVVGVGGEIGRYPFLSHFKGAKYTGCTRPTGPPTKPANPSSQQNNRAQQQILITKIKKLSHSVI